MNEPKRTFGGRQDGAGRPAKAPDEKVRQRTLYLPPDIEGRLIDSVGDGRGAVVGEIVRILKLYYDTPRQRLRNSHMSSKREGDTTMHQLASNDEQWTTLSNLYDQVYTSMHVKHEITNESALAIMNAIEGEMAKLEKPRREGYINDDDLAE